MDIQSLIEKEMKENVEDQCLISGEPLNWSRIQLHCGHWFNYESIYKEFKYQLKLNKFKPYQNKQCPYCRSKIDYILPPCKGFRPVQYVNKDGKPLFIKTCSWVMKSGKRKGEKCSNYCVYERCKTHKSR